MRNATSIKDIVKNKARQSGLSAQIVMQCYMLERLLERISLSSYRDKVILKGGLLIASMVGIDSRATKDMDAAIRDFPLEEGSVRKMLEEIFQTDVEDGIRFSLKSLRTIREEDDYEGFRASVLSEIQTTRIPLQIDLTTGDVITPAAVEYGFPLTFENRVLKIFAYNLETVLAEKLEAILSRGEGNTRLRDFYDVYVLANLDKQSPDYIILRNAFQKTSAKRESLQLIPEAQEILLSLRESKEMNKRWVNYQKKFVYADGIPFGDVCSSISRIFAALFPEQPCISPP